MAVVLVRCWTEVNDRTLVYGGNFDPDSFCGKTSAIVGQELPIAKNCQIFVCYI